MINLLLLAISKYSIQSTEFTLSTSNHILDYSYILLIQFLAYTHIFHILFTSNLATSVLLGQFFRRTVRSPGLAR